MVAPGTALFIKARMRVYLALHPETAQGARERGGRKGRQLGDDTAKRFTADTAAKGGQSERKVQRDADHGEKIDEGVLKFKGTAANSAL